MVSVVFKVTSTETCNAAVINHSVVFVDWRLRGSLFCYGFNFINFLPCWWRHLSHLNIDLCYIHCLVLPSCVLLSTLLMFCRIACVHFIIPTRKQSLGHIQCFVRPACKVQSLKTPKVLWNVSWKSIFCFISLTFDLPHFQNTINL